MNQQVFTDEEVQQFHRDSFIVVEGLLDPEETRLLFEAANNDYVLMQNAHQVKDAEGRDSKLALWDHPGDDIYGMIARSHKIVDRMEQLLGGEVYHYHSTMMLKEPRVGGAWEWHQDYGYWYYNGCLRPDMLSMMVALDRSDRGNGCLQVIRGSHALGRIDHLQVTEKQNSADPARLEHILERHEAVHCELDPGDALIFHANTLHRSDQNQSANRRWTLIICYNAVANDTVTRDDDRYYVPLDKVGDDAVLAAGLKFATGGREHFTSQAYVPAAEKAS